MPVCRIEEQAPVISNMITECYIDYLNWLTNPATDTEPGIEISGSMKGTMHASITHDRGA